MTSVATRFNVAAPCAMIALPVADSPTKAIARIAGCSVSALPASSPRPCTTFRTPWPCAAQAQPPADAASAAAPAASSAPASSVEQLKREIDALQGLLEGRLPQGLSLPGLFEIDLADPSSVAQRSPDPTC